MTENRNTTAPVFITVLCACLGLLVAGMPAEAHPSRAASETAHYRASSIRLSLAASVASGLPALKVDGRWLPASAAQAKGQPDSVSYQENKALTDIDQVLLITCLPRASISDRPAKPSQASPGRDEV